MKLVIGAQKKVFGSEVGESKKEEHDSLGTLDWVETEREEMEAREENGCGRDRNQSEEEDVNARRNMVIGRRGAISKD